MICIKRLWQDDSEIPRNPVRSRIARIAGPRNWCGTCDEAAADDDDDDDSVGGQSAMEKSWLWMLWGIAQLIAPWFSFLNILITFLDPKYIQDPSKSPQNVDPSNPSQKSPAPRYSEQKACASLSWVARDAPNSSAAYWKLGGKAEFSMVKPAPNMGNKLEALGKYGVNFGEPFGK